LSQFDGYSGKTGEVAKDFWWFTYYANGLNPCDALHLKEEHIQGDCISFIRQKAGKKNKSGKLILIDLCPDLRAIIERRKANGYLFGSDLRQGMSAIEETEYIRTFRKSKNDSLWRISKLFTLRFPINLSMAGPLFATSMKLGGVSNEQTADEMGHSHSWTTNGYQGSIGNRQTKNNAVHLTAFR